jgi:hypothetical protein
MRDACRRSCKKIDLLRVELHAMGVPDIRPGPAQILGVLPRTAAEILQRIGHVFVVLGQMRVHHHALVSRQKGGIAHQLAADGKGRAGRDGDADHGAGARIVETVYDADAVV